MPQTDNKELLKVIQDQLAQKVAEGLVSDESTRTNILAVAVSNVLNLEDNEIRRTMDYSVRQAITTAVSEVAVAHVKTPEVAERIRTTIDAMVEETVTKVMNQLPEIITALIQKGRLY